MNEEWKDIPGYEGKYYVSNFGNIKNSSGLLMKPMKCTNGYLSACLWKNNKQKKILIHRLVANMFIANDRGYTEVNHKDEDKTNNMVNNLEWCSHIYNMNYGNVRKKISMRTKGRKLSEAHKKKCASAKGKKWINNYENEMLVKMDEIPSFFILGYVLGRLSKNDRKSKPLSC